MRYFSIFAGLTFFLIQSASFADLRVSERYINFGSVNVGEHTMSRAVYVTNMGDEDTFVTVRDQCFGDYYISDTCFGVLVPHASCQLRVEFLPRSRGYKTCDIYVYEENRSAGVRISVRGWGR